MVSIKAHVATIGYEDSNPFSLIEWAVKCAKQGYTEVVEEEFSVFLLTPEDKATADAIDENNVIYSCYTESTHAEYDEDWDSYDLVVEPLNDLVSIDGDITATT